MKMWGCAVAGLMVGALPMAAAAQETAPPIDGAAPADVDAPAPGQEEAPGEEELGEEIVVTGTLRGAVQGDIPPEIQLSPADVRAYGVASIAELITELAPQTGSGRGRGGEGPVVLLNGRRISNFSEIRTIPTEAIERVDILPEEVALKYGYRADQRVVNIVLRRRFRALTTELDGRTPTEGGFVRSKSSFDLLKINRDGRINLNVQYDASSGLVESERDVISPRAGFYDSPFRTLVAPSKELTINGVVARVLSPKVNATVNGRLEASQRRSLQGLDTLTLTVPEDNPFATEPTEVEVSRVLDELLPLSRSTKSLTAHGGFSVNGDGTPWSNDWRWAVNGNYDRVTSKTTSLTGIDNQAAQDLVTAGDPRFNPFGPIDLTLVDSLPSDIARSTSSVGTIDALFNGPLFKLPAGKASTSIRINGRTSDLDSRSFRSGITRVGDISRDSGSVQANLDLPITSRRLGVLDAVGDISLNGNIEVEQLSDFGTLVTTGYGANWSPIKQLRFLVSVTDEEGAPSASQLGDPMIATPNVQVFDYVRGESVAATTITGGNRGLGSDSRHVFKLGMTVRPLSETDLTLSADYVTSTARNQISAFPAVTAEIAAAFPERFVREPSVDGVPGRLISVDNRAVNFARAEREQLRWGFNLSLPLTTPNDKAIAARRAERQAAREQAERDGTPLPPEGQGNWRGRQGQGAQGGPGGEGGPRQQGGFFGGGGPRGPGGGGFGRGPGGGGPSGRVQFSVYHTWRFVDRITIREGLPVLDLLDGSASGNSGGQPRHELEANAGLFRNGLGVRLTGKWESGTEVATGTLGSGDRLDFGSLATLNLRLFADMGQQQSLARDHRWLRGMRLSFAVDNVFNTRQRVTNELGVVPVSYQPGLIDPTGRLVRLSVRKLFF